MVTHRRVTRWACSSLLLVYIVGFGGVPTTNAELDAAQGPECDLDVMILLHTRFKPVVEDLAQLHYGVTSARLSEVVEHISVFQLDRLLQAALKFIEALRLTMCLFVCASSYMLPDLTPEEMVNSIALSAHLRQLFAGLEHVASEDDGPNNLTDLWAGAFQGLLEGTSRLETWTMQSLVSGLNDENGWAVPGAEKFSRLEGFLASALKAVMDLVHSIAEDTAGLYRTPNYLAKEMLPRRKSTVRDLAGNNFSIYGSSTTDRSRLDYDFMAYLRDPPAPLRQPALTRHFAACADLPPVRSSERLLSTREFMETPKAQIHRDVSGSLRSQLSPLQLLRSIAPHVRLSNLYVSLQLDSAFLSPPPKCGSSEILYDPCLCLEDANWGGYTFQMNPFGPFNLSVLYSGKSLGIGHKLPTVDIHTIEVGAKELQYTSLISLLKSVNHHSPDLLFVNPFVANCRMFDRLLVTGTIRPKLAYLPFNPLDAPPLRTSPDFLAWWDKNGAELVAQLGAGLPSEGTAPSTTSIWTAQCSLSELTHIMESHAYTLIHVEHTYAAFMQTGQLAKVKTDAEHGERPLNLGMDLGALQSPDPVWAKWMEGWHCTPHARYVFLLEALSRSKARGAPSVPPAKASSETDKQLKATDATPDVPLLRYFLERDSRGRCVSGSCECYPPFRGTYCDIEDPPRVEQKLRGVIHYITAETERDMRDLELSLSTLWQNLNHFCDYPIVIFHEGLSQLARHRIVAASANRLWFVQLPEFKRMPEEWAEIAKHMASEFSLGYRAMIRWRSGPVFLEPALARFDYAMTLDTDSYFPAHVGEDPFQTVANNGWVAAFPHLGRESASVVVNFLHYYLVYAKLLGLHPRRTRVLQSLVEKNFKWYQQCLMLDIEILKLDFFRGQQYQDMFRFMDATGGFWLHRWGNNPFRTFAVGLLLDDENVTALHMPYAHQDFCSCGAPPGSQSCAWQGDSIGYRCPQQAGDPNVNAVGSVQAFPLDEGLLDLQPWRGTERQRQRFNASEVVQFVEEGLQ